MNEFITDLLAVDIYKFEFSSIPYLLYSNPTEFFHSLILSAYFSNFNVFLSFIVTTLGIETYFFSVGLPKRNDFIKNSPTNIMQQTVKIPNTIF